jgi:hypothetical protein
MARWPLALLAAGVAFASLMGWSVWRAVHGVSPVSDPAYYARGLHHDRDAGADWRLASELDGRTLRLRVLDGSGRALTGAAVEFRLRGTPPLALPLGEGAPGVYGAALPSGLAAPISGVLRVERGGTRVEKPVLLNPPAP